MSDDDKNNKPKRSYKRSIKAQTDKKNKSENKRLNKARKALQPKPKKAFEQTTRQGKNQSDLVNLNTGIFQKEILSKTSTKEPLKEQIELLMLDWALFYSNDTVYKYITVTKGYSKPAYTQIVTECPVEEWKVYKEQARNKMSKDMLSRHIDIIAQANDEHLKYAQVGLRKVAELILKGSPIMSKLKLKKGRTGANGQADYIIPVEIGRRPFYPKEAVEMTTAYKTIVQVYRTILGLPNDEGAIQAFEALMKQQSAINLRTTNIQVNNNTVNVGEKDVEDLKEKMESLSYDDLKVFIEHKRKKKEVVNE